MKRPIELPLTLETILGYRRLMKLVKLKAKLKVSWVSISAIWSLL